MITGMRMCGFNKQIDAGKGGKQDENEIFDNLLRHITPCLQRDEKTEPKIH